MINELNPQDEFLHEHPGTPLWTEGFMFQGYSPATEIGVFFHLGRASWGDPNIWLERISITFPGDVVATSMAYRKGNRVRGGGTEAAFADCIEPFRRWQVSFDCAAQLTNMKEMLSGRLRMGANSRLRLELDWHSTGPVWDQRHMKIDSLKSVHFEQAGWMTGFVEFNGEHFTFEGPGRRDRSWGVRNMTSLRRHTILHGEFPQTGIAFSTAMFELNDQPAPALRGYVAAGLDIEDITSGRLPGIPLFSSRHTPFEAHLGTRSREYRIQGKVLQSVAHALLPPNDVCCGVDRDDPNSRMLWLVQVAIELDGAQGYGFLERSLCPGDPTANISVARPD